MTVLGLNEGGSRSFVLTVTLTGMATIAVCFRLLSNIYTKTSMHADFMWVVVSLIGMYGYAASTIWGVLMSKGIYEESEIQAHPRQARYFLKSTIPYFEFFVFTNMTIKVSAIMLYRRLFPTKRFGQISQLVLIAVAVWWVVISIQWALICQPLSLFWSPSLVSSLTSQGELARSATSSLNGYCNSPNVLLFVGDMVNILLDHVVLFMPLPLLYGLNIPTRSKVGLMLLFSVGTFSCVSALVRLVFMFKPHRFYPGLADGQIWSSLHLGSGIIYACIPSYRPLGRKLLEQGRRYFSRISSTRRNGGVDASGDASERHRHGNGASTAGGGVTPLMRNNSGASAPVSPRYLPVYSVFGVGRGGDVDDGATADYSSYIPRSPKVTSGWTTPRSVYYTPQRTGASSAASWVDRSRHESGKANTFDKAVEGGVGAAI